MGAVVVDDDGRYLLVRRARDPGRGLWSVPGGRVEQGETDDQATCREVLEETGLRVEVVAHVGSVERPAPDGGTFVIHDYRCTLASGAEPGRVRAGDDAEEAGWFEREQLLTMPLVPGLREALEEWGVLG